jgi:hypothetical protein
VGEGVLRPRVSRLDRERAFRHRLGGGVVAAQLAGECRHREKIRILRVRAFEAAHVRAKPWSHVLLAKHVIEELCDLGGQEIARPLGGDRLHGLNGAQIVIAMPERERPMERTLARVHRECLARAQVDRRGLKRAVGLAVEPERRGVELNDRCVGPALCGVENGLDALIETQQPCGEVVRRRYGSCVIGGHIEAARVFHRVTLSLARVRRQSGA